MTNAIKDDFQNYVGQKKPHSLANKSLHWHIRCNYFNSSIFTLCGVTLRNTILALGQVFVMLVQYFLSQL